MSTVQEALSMDMTLSASERASLAHELILSLDDPMDAQLTATQETEIQRRLAAVREGTATGRPANEVFAEIRKSGILDRKNLRSVQKQSATGRPGGRGVPGMLRGITASFRSSENRF